MGLDIFFEKKKTKELGYFRKVNFLVKYFENLGFDIERGEFRVYEQDIKELIDKCDEVIKDHSKAKELLPTRAGFFFGSTEYSEGYYEDVKSVKEYLEKELLPEFRKLKDDESIFFSISY